MSFHFAKLWRPAKLSYSGKKVSLLLSFPKSSIGTVLLLIGAALLRYLPPFSGSLSPLRPPRLRLGLAVSGYRASTTTLLPQTDQPDVGGAEVDFLPVSISLLIPRIKSGMAVTNLLTVGVLILMSANHAIAQGKIPSVYYFYALWQEISCYKIAFNCTFLNE